MTIHVIANNVIFTVVWNRPRHLRGEPVVFLKDAPVMVVLDGSNEAKKAGKERMVGVHLSLCSCRLQGCGLVGPHCVEFTRSVGLRVAEPATGVVCYFFFLLLCNKFPQTEWPKQHFLFESHNFSESGVIGAWVSWALSSGSRQADIKVSAGPCARLELWVLFQGHSGCWQNSGPAVARPRSYLLADLGLPSGPGHMAPP